MKKSVLIVVYVIKLAIQIFQKQSQNSYYGWSCDEENREKSSSGGIFGELGKYIIENNGVVFGVGFDEQLNIIHKEAVNLEQLEELKGSKYVQSSIGDSYQKVKKILETGREVLFSGTPCQINGLYQYLRKNYENLYTIDVICHGVASPKVYKKYIHDLEEYYKAKAKEISFRDKTYGWKKFSMKVTFENGMKYVKTLSEDYFIQGFLKNVYLRESCYQCQYTTTQRQGDITLGDFWGVEKNYPQLSDDKGISLILVNTDKGKKLLESCNQNIKTEKIEDIDYVIENNTSLIKPVAMNKKRKEFFKDLDTLNFEELYKKYIYENKIQKKVNIIKRKIKQVVR